MKIIPISPEYRAISIVALIQVGVVIGGTLFVTAMLKAHGYKGGEVPDSFFSSEALFIRHFGLTLLVLPVLWAFIAITMTRKALWDWIPIAMLLLGSAAILAGIWGYVLVGLSPTSL